MSLTKENSKPFFYSAHTEHQGPKIVDVCLAYVNQFLGTFKYVQALDFRPPVFSPCTKTPLKGKLGEGRFDARSDIVSVCLAYADRQEREVAIMALLDAGEGGGAKKAWHSLLKLFLCGPGIRYHISNVCSAYGNKCIPLLMKQNGEYQT
jgi:hypothetical protein